MKNILVAYFSASGVTRTAAEKLAAASGADIFEIIPETLYTPADLDWRDKNSRSTLEMQDINCRPALASTVPDMAKYDVVFLGFPIWWGREPSVVDTFIDAVDLTGKRVIPFFTSGSGGYTKREQLEKLIPGVEADKAVLRDTTESELKYWVAGLAL